jgi:hypothetical protein
LRLCRSGTSRAAGALGLFKKKVMAMRQTPRNSKLMRLGALAVVAIAVFVVIF